MTRQKVNEAVNALLAAANVLADIDEELLSDLGHGAPAPDIDCLIRMAEQLQDHPELLDGRTEEEEPKLDLIFDNGGSVTLQTNTYCHCYDDPAHAAEDVKALLAGENPTGWDGNEPECWIDPAWENVAPGSGYVWMDAEDIERYDGEGHGWRNIREFFDALSDIA